MKKTTIISGLLLSTILNAQTITTNPDATNETINTGYLMQGVAVLVSDPSDTATIVAANSVSCNASGLHADNSYYRYFDLAGLGTIEITDIDIGVETATSGTGGTQPIIIRVHSIPDGGALPASPLTLVTELSTTIADASAAIVNFPIAANLDSATNDLVIEINTPDGQTDGHTFFFGTNLSAQTNPFFLSALDCGITEPTATGDIGFPDMHGIIVVNGNGNTPVELMNFSIE